MISVSAFQNSLIVNLPNTLMLKRSVQIIVALWLITWGVLQVRLWVKDPSRVEKFFELIVSSDENRRSMVYGKEWHQFFNF